MKQYDYLTFTARLKRISDNLLYSAKDLYKTLNLEIEPNWHLIFLLFKEKQTLTITEIAEKLKISQPGVIKIVNKMKAKKYLKSEKDKKDSRIQLLKLTTKAKKELPKLGEIWLASEKTIIDILDNNPTIFEQLDRIENAISESNYKKRTLIHLDND
ncbi:MarR family winged helix-turn-helix transcriptional regulator [Tenacibaculum ovolyticum]|uniref:MarR family winged helix-turn-helix transcriptional regulator n=1 Tax=Tenacibaculum ovolyticum TaxID=104270 RepID=UPI0007EC8234|nr:MarR family winged helix-turn-helix transcriptional regulator [Tenacibaculum ovolyticum]WBX75765.1 MarR family winged helix-turn-helix transcriptional regulator [Tenacibaculum ovolyticum]